MPDSLMLLVALVAVALIFDFLNGLHDAANSIATVVSTRVLSPNVAVVWAAFFNFIAFLFFGLHVAQTVGTGIISPDIVDGQVIFGALMGAIVWNLLTWWGAIPSSSSHALIGGLIGAGAAKAGFSAVVWWGTLKTVAAIVWSPLLGFALALLLWLVVAWLLMRSTPFAVDQKFRVLQLGSAALYSIGHGANDAQKTMGIIASLLFAKGLLGSDLLRSVLGGAVLPGGDGARHARRRLAHRQDHGIEDHAAEAGARVLRRDGGGDDPLFGDVVRGSSVDDAYDHWRHHGSRGCSQGLSGSLGYCRKYNHRLGDHTARRGADRRFVLQVRDPFCCGRLTPFGGRLTPQPRHTSGAFLRSSLQPEEPVVPFPRGREVWRVCRDRGPSPNSIQRTNGNATTHIPTTKIKRMPTAVLNMSV